ncbi:MAG: CheY-like receiver [Paenibacillaceae bacterium]|jgi:CheY-like chemotaxis protein|nr:CheY-like receiver [Paenibacillaceae bacterium]
MDKHKGVHTGDTAGGGTGAQAERLQASKLCTVMVAEDHPVNMMLLREILKNMGCRTIEAPDGAVALKMLEAMEELPDILLTDVMMPHLDGITLTKWLRHLPRYDSLPIIIISAFAAQEDIEAAKEAGCTAYLTKPLEVRPFMQLVSRYLNAGASSPGIF